MIKFSIPGEPVAKARARVTKQGHAYTPAKSANYAKLVKGYAMQAMVGKTPLNGALVAKITAYFSIPKSWPKYKRQMLLTGGLPHTKKPDMDNVIKQVLDAMNTVVYADDAAICEITARKQYSDNPRVEITISEIDK